MNIRTRGGKNGEGGGGRGVPVRMHRSLVPRWYPCYLPFPWLFSLFFCFSFCFVFYVF